MRRLLIFFFLTFAFLLFLPAARTEQQQAIKIQGLKDRVTITRDERGIPYIEAKNDEDLYFAQGYATAADRLWQMDLVRRTAGGELAEVLGAGPADAALNQDKLHRTYGCAGSRSLSRTGRAASPGGTRSLRARCECVCSLARSQ